MSSGTISDTNPLGLDGCDREIEPHEYSVDPYGPVRIGGAHALGQADRLIMWQTRSGVDACACQRCHGSIFLPPPRKLMGRWEESLGRCFYWWTQHVTPRLCGRCQERADTIASLLGVDDSANATTQRGFIRLLGEWNAKTGHRAQLVHCWPGTVLLSCEPETAKAELSAYVESILPLGISHEYEGAHPYRKEATS